MNWKACGCGCGCEKIYNIVKKVKCMKSKSKKLDPMAIGEKWERKNLPTDLKSENNINDDNDNSNKINKQNKKE